MLKNSDNNSLFAKFADTIKSSRLFSKAVDKDKYAEDFYYFNDTEENSKKKIKIDLSPDLKGIEKLIYYGF